MLQLLPEAKIQQTGGSSPFPFKGGGPCLCPMPHPGYRRCLGRFQAISGKPTICTAGTGALISRTPESSAAFPFWGISQARIDSVYIRQVHEESKVTLHLALSLNSAGEWSTERSLEELQALEKDPSYTYQVTVTAPDGSSFTLENAPESIQIPDPQLWWPNGLGSQPLYQISVDLLYKERFWTPGAEKSVCAL